MDGIQYRNGHLVRVHLRPTGALANFAAKLAASMIKDLRSRPRQDFHRSLHFTMGVIVANLAVQELRRGFGWVVVKGGEPWYTENRHWLGAMYTYNAVRHSWTFLVNRGLVERFAGIAAASPENRRTAAIRATPELSRQLRELTISAQSVSQPVDEFVVRLRARKTGDKPGKYLQFVQTEDTQGFARNLAIINRCLADHWCDIELTNAQLRNLEEEIAGKKQSRDEHVAYDVDFTRRTVYRTFCNGTFTDGGRFYGHWVQGVPSSYRPYVTIDGKRTVEVDFSAMHPTILYHRLGLPMPADPYEIGLADRKVVKRTFNALINARSGNISAVDGFDPDREGMSWREYRRAVKKAFSPFRALFGSGEGIKLQRLDSDIAESVMFEFAQDDMPLIPIHDSFIVQEEHADRLIYAMDAAFAKRTGAAAGLTEDRLSLPERLSIARKIRTKADLLVSRGHHPSYARTPITGPYGDYNRRLLEWRNHRSPELSDR